MSEQNNNQAQDLKAKLQALKEQYNEQATSTGTGSQLSEEDKALVEEIGFRGKGANGFYFVTYKDEVVSKVERVQGSTFKGELTGSQGQRQAVALSEIKRLKEAGLVS